MQGYEGKGRRIVCQIDISIKWKELYGAHAGQGAVRAREGPGAGGCHQVRQAAGPLTVQAGVRPDGAVL